MTQKAKRAAVVHGILHKIEREINDTFSHQNSKVVSQVCTYASLETNGGEMNKTSWALMQKWVWIQTAYLTCDSEAEHAGKDKNKAEEVKTNS